MTKYISPNFNSGEQVDAILATIQDKDEELEALLDLVDVQNDFLTANWQVDEAGDVVLESGVLGLKNNQLALHDGVTTGGNAVGLGLNHYGVGVQVTNDPVQNGTNLIEAYTTAKNLLPGGIAISDENRVVVLLPPGVYDLNGDALQLDTQFVDIIGLSSNRSNQIIKSELDGVDGVIVQTANDVKIHNLTVSRGSGAGNAYHPTTNLNNTECVNVRFDVDGEFLSVGSMRTGIEYSGTFVDCEAGPSSFGAAANGVASGRFERCVGNGSNCFGRLASGTFIDCEAKASRGFGANDGATGRFVRCIAAFEGFSYEAEASGEFIECESGNQSFALSSNCSGEFYRCKAGDFSFGYGNIASGKFYDCVSGEGGFSADGNASGVFTNCEGSDGSFGGSPFASGELTGKLYYCRLTTGSFPTRGAGALAKLCIDGNDNTVDDTP